MAPVPQSRRQARLLTLLFILIPVCGLVWWGWNYSRLSVGQLGLLTAHATESSLWKTVGANIPILRQMADQEWPAVAANSQDGEYLVVWQDQRNFRTTRADIYARRVAADGTPIGNEFLVTNQAQNQNFPHVVYNTVRNEYFVVWSDQRNVGATGSDVYGQRVAADGTLVGGDIAISTALRPQLYPRVAYNPIADEYLVVWQDSRTSAWTSSDIYGQRIAGDGTLLGANFVIADDPAAQNQPDVAYSPFGRQYLVAWDDEREIGTTGVDVYAQWVAGTGALLGGNFALSTTLNSQENVAVGYNPAQNEFLVVWEDSRNLGITSTDLYGQRVGGAGGLLGGNIPLSTGIGAESEPALAFGLNLGGYLLVWRDDRNEPGTGGDLFGQALNGAGAQVGNEFEIALEIGTQRRAQLAYNTLVGEFMVVWEDSRNLFLGGRDTYGQRIGPQVQPTPTPTSTATSTHTPTVTPTSTSSPTVVLTATFTPTSTATATATPTTPPTITMTPTPAGPTNTLTATPIRPTPTNTPCAYPPCRRGPEVAYLPLVRHDHLPCGYNRPDADEPANNQWESATPYGYGRWENRTFWDPSAAPGQQGSDVDWYEWVVEWTGTHWIWPENTSHRVVVYAEVFLATGDPRQPLELLSYGRGRQEVELQAGNTYYVKVKNVGSNPPTVGCYDLILDP